MSEHARSHFISPIYCNRLQILQPSLSVERYPQRDDGHAAGDLETEGEGP